jgi:hypothetical protein
LDLQGAMFGMVIWLVKDYGGREEHKTTTYSPRQAGAGSGAVDWPSAPVPR